jgi:hypothetical protein
MTNKEFRTEQLLEAGWTEKTPNSGYWHRPGVSKYFDVNRAYELELRFPEQVRTTFLKINPLTEFSKGVGSDLNPDSTNAAIIDRLQDTMRKGMQEGLDKSSMRRCCAPGAPDGIVPNPFYGQGLPNVTVPSPKKITAEQVARPRYKVATTRVYDVVVDNFSGRSIHYYKISHAAPSMSGIQARDKCMWLNRQQDHYDLLVAQSLSITPTHVVRATIDNIEAEISYLNTLRIALWAKDMDRVKELLSQKTDSQMIGSARSARHRLIASGLLKDLGIEIKA